MGYLKVFVSKNLLAHWLQFYEVFKNFFWSATRFPSLENYLKESVSLRLLSPEIHFGIRSSYSQIFFNKFIISYCFVSSDPLSYFPKFICEFRTEFVNFRCSHEANCLHRGSQLLLNWTPVHFRSVVLSMKIENCCSMEKWMMKT